MLKLCGISEWGYSETKVARDKNLKSHGFSVRLETARRRAGLNQSQLSLRAGVSRGTVFDIENGRRVGNVGLATAEQLAAALDVSASWLAFGIEDPPGPVGGVAEQVRAAQQETQLNSLLIVLRARGFNPATDFIEDLKKLDTIILEALLYRSVSTSSLNELLKGISTLQKDRV